MKKIILILLIVLASKTYSQESKIEMISKFDGPTFGSREFILENFQGIQKLDLSFTNSEKLIGKNFKYIIRKYKNGKIATEKTIHDTKKYNSPKIGKDFKFSIVTQQIPNNQKIWFFFPDHFNNNVFEVSKKFPDATFSLRDVTENSSESIVFEIGKENQIALITPPNDNPDKGDLGYCEVSKGNIDVEKWYNKYKISEFFLIYLIIED